jgi:hypothetical protein
VGRGNLKKGVLLMTTRRRKYRLANSEYSDVKLTEYEQIIIDTINQAVPGKNPKVFDRYFSTDELTQSEAVSMGRALSKIEELSAFGKEVKTFRLFDGKTYDSEEAVLPVKKHNKMKGGRFRSKL